MNSENELTDRQKNICEYGGLFGILLSLTCLVQHLVAAIPNAITNPMIPAYLLAIAAFLLLAMQKPVCLFFLISSAFLSLVIEWRWMTHYAFSLVVLLLFLYHVIIIVILYTEQIPARLKQIKAWKEAEEDHWKDKI